MKEKYTMLSKSELETNLGRVHEWTKAVDQKVSIFLAFEGVVLTLIFEHILSWTKNNFTILCDRYYIVLILSGIILISFSVYKSVSALFPRLNGGKNKSIIYFGDIASYTEKNFREKVRNTAAQEYEDEIISQTYVSSKIALKKHKQFKDAILTFFIGVFILIITFIIFSIYYGY